MRGSSTRRRPSRPRVAATVFLGILPNSGVNRFLMTRFLGWSIAPSAYIGPSIFLHVTHGEIGPGARLHGLSLYHHIESLRIGERATLGLWNWICAAPALRTMTMDMTVAGRPAEFAMGRHAAVTSRHYIDCSGGVRLGDFSCIAGVRSTILTHQVNTERSEQEISSVAIGDYCFIGSNVKMVPGACVPDRCVVAMGSVVSGPLPRPNVLYAGVPARLVKEIQAGAYFGRSNGPVDIP